MQRSKATAALMRLKEIDRKYKSKVHEEKQLESSISTVSTFNSISNGVKKSIPGSGDSSDTGLKPKLKIKMPEAHIEQVEEILLERKRDSSTIAVTIFNKNPEELLDTNSHVITKEVNHNATNLDSIGPAGEGNVTDSVELIKGNKTSSDEKFVTEVSEEQSQIISKLSCSKDDQISEDLDPERTESLSSSKILLDISTHSQKAVPSDTYSNDSFEEESNSFPTYENSNDSKSSGTSSMKTEMQKKSNKSEQSYSKQTDVISYSQYSVNRTNNNDETKIVELMSPKPIHTTSVCEVDLDKELSRYVKIIENTESGESIKPICLLKSPKVCVVQKQRPKRSSRAKSSMNSHESKTAEVQIISRHQTHADNILSKKRYTKQEPGSQQNSPKTQFSRGPKTPSNSKKSGFQKREGLDIAIVLKKKEEPARTTKLSSVNEPIVQREDDISLPSNHLKQEIIGQRTAQEFHQNLKNNPKFPRSPKKDMIHIKQQKHKSHQGDNSFNKIISSHHHGAPCAIDKTVNTKPVAVTRVTDTLDLQNIKAQRNQTLFMNSNVQQPHKDKVAKSRNNAKNTKLARSQKNPKSSKDETFVPRRKREVDAIETQLASLRIKHKQNNHQAKVSRYIQQFEEERRKLMLCPVDHPYIHKTESLAFKPLDFPKIIEFTRPGNLTERAK